MTSLIFSFRLNLTAKISHPIIEIPHWDFEGTCEIYIALQEGLVNGTGQISGSFGNVIHIIM